TDAEAIHLLTDLIIYHNLVSMIVCVNQQLCIRIGVQIYNRIEDYIFLADTIDKLK
ncbi:unnamed protein product, partial [Rotaria sordida]